MSVANDLAQVTGTKALFGGDTWATARLMQIVAESVSGNDEAQVSQQLPGTLFRFHARIQDIALFSRFRKY